ncbi:hypothetical protein LSTR_LSTR015920 [Laodelphax striatellus]|uniref:Uncharacterized protein n=1 Tax=Laodelphax striatellus TaxID=195883 RepID=A0A482XQW4_LAOST|nr:hypothetical protein LSTR_LSTR015920 [Laodelphax striatellus]
MVDKRGHLVYNRTALLEAGYDSNASSLHCVYQQITRAADDDFNVVYGDEIQMTGDDQLTTDFVFVECRNFATIAIYQNFHAYVQRDPTVHRFKKWIRPSAQCHL